MNQLPIVFKKNHDILLFNIAVSFREDLDLKQVIGFFMAPTNTSIRFSKAIHIIGAGFAGSEAALYLANNQYSVHLYEMRPLLMTPNYRTSHSLTLRHDTFREPSPGQDAPIDILQNELKYLGSEVLKCSLWAQTPTGLDRLVLSQEISQRIYSHPNIIYHNGIIDRPFQDGITLITTGHLRHNRLSEWIQKTINEEYCYFYNPVTPVIDAKTIQWEHTFTEQRPGYHPTQAHVYCPLHQEEYINFSKALAKAPKIPTHAFEQGHYLLNKLPLEHACIPHSPYFPPHAMQAPDMINPKTQQKPYAALTLQAKTTTPLAYALLGFQTHCSYEVQPEIFKLIPALAQAEYLRLGSMHRSAYIRAPKILNPDLSMKVKPHIYLSGQITGIQGYLESIAMGLLAGIFIEQRIKNLPHKAPPATTALGALLRHVISSNPDTYQPRAMHGDIFEKTFFDDLDPHDLQGNHKKISLQSQAHLSQWKRDANISIL